MKKITSLVLGLMVVLPLSATPALASSDTVAPTKPLNLNASVVSVSQVNLNWSASTDNVGVSGYNIYNKNILIGTSTSTSFVNTGLTPDTKYKYKIKAFDAAGNLSHQSTKVTAVTKATPDTIAPSVPVGLSALAVSSKQINLNWSNSSDNAKTTGYNIYRNNVLIGTSSKSMLKDTGLASSTLYTYRISAYDAAGNVSAQSVVISATTLAPDTIAPSTPSVLKAIINFKNKVMLSWAASTDNVSVAQYQIMRNGTLLGVSKETKYIDRTVATSTAYTYAVVALDADGNASATSTIVSITTPATTTPIKKNDNKKEDWKNQDNKNDRKEHQEKFIEKYKNNYNKELKQNDFKRNDSNHNDQD